jgi:hypothetical protein
MPAFWFASTVYGVRSVSRLRLTPVRFCATDANASPLEHMERDERLGSLGGTPQVSEVREVQQV